MISYERYGRRMLGAVGAVRYLRGIGHGGHHGGGGGGHHGHRGGGRSRVYDGGPYFIDESLPCCEQALNPYAPCVDCSGTLGAVSIPTLAEWVGMGAAGEPVGFAFGIPTGGPVPGQGAPDAPALSFAPAPAPVVAPPYPVNPLFRAKPPGFTYKSPALQPQYLPAVGPAGVCPPIPPPPSKVGPVLAGAAAGGLLMWVVGLATKEAKKRRRR
jgi:hypothetical protein